MNTVLCVGFMYVMFLCDAKYYVDSEVFITIAVTTEYDANHYEHYFFMLEYLIEV